MSKLLRSLVTLALVVSCSGALIYSSPVRAEVATPEVNLNHGKKLNALVLGDSFSAGNGLGNYYGPKECYRSGDNWAHKYINSLIKKGTAASLTNHACGGATTNDILNPRKFSTDHYDTVDGKLDVSSAKAYINKKCSSSAFSDEISYSGEYIDSSVRSADAKTQTSIHYQCNLVFKAQSSFVGRQTDMVLISIGGNDLNVANIITQCFVFVARDMTSCQQSIDSAKKDLSKLKSRYSDVFSKFRSSGLRDDAKVVVLGYPLLALDSDYHLSLLNGSKYYAAREIRNLGDSGNKMIKAAIDEDNKAHPGQVIFVDNIPKTFAGHEPDPSVLRRNPNRWLSEFLEPGFDPNEWYHPNSKGANAYTTALATKLEEDKSADYLQNVKRTGRDVDVIFNIDTTGSMQGVLSNAEDNALNTIEEIKKNSRTARFAVTTFRDDPSYTGDPIDYASKVNLDFTDDAASIKSALNSLEADGGGDEPETVYSGINAGLDLNWRPGVDKIIITITDTVAHDPEPISGLTVKNITDKAFSIDPVQLYILDTSWEGLSDDPGYRELTENSSGSILKTESTAETSSMITQAILQSVEKPFAWINGPYVAKVNSPVELNAGGSYSPSGDIVSYDWDFNQDGIYDEMTTEPITTHIFTSEIDGLLAVRITDSDGKTNIANTPIMITDDGDSTPRSMDNCPDVYNYSQSDYDHDGIGDECDETPGYKIAYDDKPLDSPEHDVVMGRTKTGDLVIQKIHYDTNSASANANNSTGGDVGITSSQEKKNANAPTPPQDILSLKNQGLVNARHSTISRIIPLGTIAILAIASATVSFLLIRNHRMRTK